MARISGLLLIAGLLVVSLVGCGDFFEFHSPNGSTDDGGGNPTGSAMFFDDFKGGADPAWAAASGTWTTEGGLYSPEESVGNWLNTYVKTTNSKTWGNYTVDVELKNAKWSCCFSQQTAAIVLRAQDDLNKVMFIANDNKLYWNVLVDGAWKYSEDKGVVTPGLTEAAHIRIRAENSTYTAYVRQGDQGDLIKRTTFDDDTFSHGMPGLSVFSPHHILGIDFDSFKVTAHEN